MRIILAIAVWVVFVGGTFAYMQHRDAALSAQAPPARATTATQTAPAAPASAQPAAPPADPNAPRGYTLEVLATFAGGADPFRLHPGDGPALVLELGGRRILAQEALVPGQPVVVADPPGLAWGRNEVTVAAQTAAPEADAAVSAAPPAALRLRLVQGLVTRSETTLWAQGGAIRGQFAFTLAPPEASHE